MDGKRERESKGIHTINRTWWWQIIKCPLFIQLRLCHLWPNFNQPFKNCLSHTLKAFKLDEEIHLILTFRWDLFLNPSYCPPSYKRVSISKPLTTLLVIFTRGRWLPSFLYALKTCHQVLKKSLKLNCLKKIYVILSSSRENDKNWNSYF